MIPSSDDYFAPLLGDWEFDYVECTGIKAKGEWYFRRGLDGMAIVDIFICPSRATRDVNPQPHAEYGMTIRTYNFGKCCWDMIYTCPKYTSSLQAEKEGDSIVCKNLKKPENKWIFKEITGVSFHWQNVDIAEDGEEKVFCDIYANRL